LLAVSYRYDLDYYLHEENFTSIIPAHTAYVHTVEQQCSLCCHTPTQSQTHKHAPDFQRIYAKKTALKTTLRSLHIDTVIESSLAHHKACFVCRFGMHGAMQVIKDKISFPFYQV